MKLLNKEVLDKIGEEVGEEVGNKVGVELNSTTATGNQSL